RPLDLPRVQQGRARHPESRRSGEQAGLLGQGSGLRLPGRSLGTEPEGGEHADQGGPGRRGQAAVHRHLLGLSPGERRGPAERVPAAGQVRLPGGRSEARDEHRHPWPQRQDQGQRPRVRFGDAADEPAHRRRGGEHPHLRDQQLGQPGWPVQQGRRDQGACRGGPGGERGALTMRLHHALAWLGLVLALPAAAADYAALPGGRFASVMPADGKAASAQIAPFRLRVEPVTNAEFLAFVKTHPEWRRDRVAGILADVRYLSHWAGPLALGREAKPRQPVTRVSWFAAAAYCESEGARLPTWYEWEYA